MNSFFGLNSRIDRLNRLIALEAPSLILAVAYDIALRTAERENTRLEEVKAIGLKLEEVPEFKEHLQVVVRDANLRAAGFCITLIGRDGANKAERCMKPSLPDNTMCESCNAEFEAEVKADEEYDASPEGIAEAAEWAKQQEGEDDDRY